MSSSSTSENQNWPGVSGLALTPLEMKGQFPYFSSLPQFVQHEIFVQTPIKDFAALCSTDKAMSHLCSGQLSDEQKLLYGDRIVERLYRERSERWFDDEVLSFKEPDMSWQEFYKRVVKMLQIKQLDIKKLHKLIEKSKLMELKILQNRNKLPLSNMARNSLANIAAAIGNKEILYWFSTLTPPILPNIGAAHRAATRGNLRALKMLMDDFNIMPNRYVANAAAESGSLQILEWLSQLAPPLRPIYPDMDGATAAYKNDQYKVLKWLAALPPPIGPIYPIPEEDEEDSYSDED